MTEALFTMTAKEKASYSIGVQTGLQLKQQFSEIDLSMLVEGLTDAVENGDVSALKLPLEEINGILGNLRKQLDVQQKKWIDNLSKTNKKLGEEFLAANKLKEGVVTLESGLQYKVLSRGAEGGAHPTILDTVKVHYRGHFIDQRVFDSSYQRGEPISIPLNRMIPGWSEVLQLMSVGDRWEVYIPSYLAYGEQGFGPAIAPNMTLIFELELIAIQSS